MASEDCLTIVLLSWNLCNVNVVESTNIGMAPVKLNRCNKGYKVKTKITANELRTILFSQLPAFCSLSLIYMCLKLQLC